MRALAAGADDYVTKPFGPRELVARLEAALRRAGPRPIEPVIAPTGSRSTSPPARVRRDGEQVHLTPTEFELLRALLSEPRPADDPPARCWSRSGGRRTKTTSRSCAPTSPTCGARSSRRGRRPLHPHRPRRRLPLRRLERPSRNLYTSRLNFVHAALTGRAHDRSRATRSRSRPLRRRRQPVADVFAIALALVLFALLYWAIDLIDRI